MTAPPSGLLLAVHPTTRGFGWVIFERPQMPVEWGIASVKDGRNIHLVNRFRHLLRRFEPTALVLEQFEGGGARRSERIQELCGEMLREASAAGARSLIFRRDQVAPTLGLSGKATRHDVALAVVERLDAFGHRLPPKRKPWIAEDPRQSLFDAAALALTYYARKDEN